MYRSTLTFSFVICTFNGGKRLPRVLEAIVRQKKIDDSEIIVVDNGSHEDISLILQRFVLSANTKVQMQTIREERQGLSFARQTGVLNAKNQIVVFVDDDNVLDGDWIDALGSCFEKDSLIGAVGAMGVPEFEGDEPSWFTQYQSAFACGLASPVGLIEAPSVSSLYGAGLAVKREVLLRLYQESSILATGRSGSVLTAGDDTEICRLIQLKGFKLYQGQHRFYHLIPQLRTENTYVQKLFWGFGRIRPTLLDYERQILKKNRFWFGFSIALELIKSSLKIVFLKGIHRDIRKAYVRGLIRSEMRS